ncbi:MAG: hypothetical protein L6R38_003149 [Xanthoria sp. 2 TBL-2021]|nr:MAG: hypothetical protein L6R38_003149 [Xanthoria sp. 2 TBL-2021]
MSTQKRKRSVNFEDLKKLFKSDYKKAWEDLSIRSIWSSIHQDEYNNDTNRNDEDDKEGAIYDGEGVQANPLVRRTRLEREQKRLEDETRVDGYRTSRSRNGYSNSLPRGSDEANPKPFTKRYEIKLLLSVRVACLNVDISDWFYYNGGQDK